MKLTKAKTMMAIAILAAWSFLCYSMGEEMGRQQVMDEVDDWMPLHPAGGE